MTKNTSGRLAGLCFAFTLLIFYTQAQTISGNFSPTSCGSFEYDYDAGYLITGVTWQVSGGTVTSTSVSGTTYIAMVHWTSIGNGGVSIRSTADGQLAQHSVTVTAGATPGAPSAVASSFARCGPGSVSLQASPGTGGNTINWYSSSTGGSVLPGGASTTVYPVTGTNGATYYFTTYSTTTHCESLSRSSSSITINAVPDAPSSVTNSFSVCGASPITVHGSTSSGTVVWYGNNTDGTVDNGALQQGDYSTYLSSTATFYAGSMIPYASGITCETAPTNRKGVTVTVKPIPDASATSSAVCSGGNATVTFSNPNNTPSTTFSWAATPSTIPYPDVSINSTSTTPTSVTQNLSMPGSTFTSGSVKYTVTPTANGCQGLPVTATVTVNPIPNVTTSPATQTVCPGAPISSILVSSNVNNTTLTWTASPPNNNYLSGYANGSGSTIAQTLDNTGSATYTLTYSITGTAAGCTGPGYAYVYVSPRPVVYTHDTAFFVGPTNVKLTSNLSNPTYNFTIFSNGNVSNAGAGSTTSAITQSLGLTGSVNSGSVIYAVTGTVAGCTGHATNVKVSVYQTPAALVNGIASSSSSNYYLNYGNALTLSSGAFYSSYQWYNGTTPISNATSSSFIPFIPGAYKVLATLPGSTQTAWSGVINVTTPALASDVNSVSRTVFYKSGTNTTSPYSLQSSDLIRSIVYSDGLGRPVQRVGVAQSPTGDLVIPTVPGKNGLTDSTFLPYATAGVQGLFQSKAVRGSSATTSYNTSDQYLFYQNTAKVASDANPYAQVIFRNTPDARVTEQGAPGAAWQPGTTHTVRNAMALSTSSSYPVLYWNANGTTSGYYTDNTVWVTTITDENNHVVNMYKNKLGQTVLKQVQADASTWLLTYYVYDSYGQLVYQLPPKAMTTLGSGTALDANSTSVAELIYQYKYDSVGNVIEKKVPGSAKQWIVYDKLGRVALTQDGNQRAQGVWAFVKYDYKNRPVYTGTYTSASDRPTLQKVFNNINYNTQPWYEARTATAGYQGYTNTVYPTTNLQLLTATYFDDYDFDNNGTADYSYDASHLASMPQNASTSTRGLATGNRKLILASSNWLTTVAFYDNFDRPIQTLSNNHVNLNMNDKVSVLYFTNNLSSKPQKIKTTHSAASTINVTQRYTYDNAWRTVGIYQMIDNEPNEQLVAQYKYNALGQPVEKNLHLLYDTQDGQTGTLTADNLVESQYKGENQLVARNMVQLLPGYNVKAGATMWRAAITTVTQTQAEANGRFLQSVDMRYNIRGWLTSINNAQLTSDGTTNDDANDYFGMELAYNTDAGMGNSQYYNGNISAVKWKGPGASTVTGTTDQRSFKYGYDYSDRLTTTTFAANTGSAWTKEKGTLNENMTYDVNGNIVKLNRKQNLRSLNGTSIINTPQMMDSLSYSYAIGNQLSNVVDNSTNVAGFNDGTTGTGTEYTYNTHGSMITDQNKGISGIIYNVLGKAQQVTFTNGTTIVYTYDAAGTKLKTVTTVSGTATTADYVNNFVYSNSALSFFSSPEGRVVKTGSNYEYQYAIADHQGNTRVVFTSAESITQSVSAGFETASQTTEASNFSNYQTGAHINTVATNAHTGTNSLWLNGGYAGQVGVAKTYKVFPGDQLSIQAYAKYNASSGSSNLAGFASALLTAFNLATPAPGELGTPSSAINTWGGLEAGGYGDGTTDNSDPKVFVNIVLFDKNYKFLDVTFAQVTFSGSLMSASYKVKEAGYAYLYVSNENPTLVDVYFDDVTMSYTPNNIIQSNEYYAHGMPTANSWTRDNAIANNFLGNGGTELNATSSLYDLDFRNYDPILGRLNQVDPMASKYASHTPYNYGFNSPIMFTDVSGADPDDEYDAFGYRIPGRDQAFNHGGASGSIRSDGNGGYYQDSNGNGVQDNGEQYATHDQMLDYYGSAITTVTDPKAMASIVASVTNQIVARYSVELGQNGVSYGYNIGVNSAGQVVLVDRTNLATNANTVYDFGGYYGIAYAFSGADPDLNPSTVGNWFFIYGGPNNPKSYDGTYNYSLSPKNMSDKLAYNHDKGYDKKNAVGALDLVLNPSVIQEDATFIAGQLQITGLYLSQFSTMGYSPAIDPITGQPYTFNTAVNAFVQGVGLGLAATPKMAVNLVADIFK